MKHIRHLAVFVALHAMCVAGLYAQSDAPILGVGLWLECSPSAQTAPTGQHFQFHIGWGVDNGNGTAVNPKFTILLPSSLNTEAYDVSTNPLGVQIVIGSEWTAAILQSPSRIEVTSPVNTISGSGSFFINLAFPPGVTPNGTQACLDVTFQADGANQPNPARSQCCVTAAASPPWYITKNHIGGNAVNGVAYYNITLVEHANSDIGGVNLQSAYVEESLPANAVVVYDQYGADQYLKGQLINGKLRWYLNATSADPDGKLEIMHQTFNYVKWECVIGIRYPSPHYAAGNTVLNTVQVLGQPLGSGPGWASSTADESLVLENAFSGGDVAKQLVLYGYMPQYHTPASIGCPAHYRLHPRNTGNTDLQNYLMTDNIPKEIKVTRIYSGRYMDYTGNGLLTIRCDTRETVPPYTTHQRQMSGIAWTTGYSLLVYDAAPPNGTGLGCGPNEVITNVVWDFGTVPTGWAVDGYPMLDFEILPDRWDASGPVNEGDVVTNNASVSWVYNSQPASYDISLPFTIKEKGPAISIAKNVDESTPPPYSPGDIIKYTITVYNDGNDYLNQCVITDVLPAGLSFVTQPDMPNGFITSSECELTNNDPVPFTFSHNGQTLTWSVAALPHPACGYRCGFTIQFYAQVGPDCPPGEQENTVTVTGANHVPAEATNTVVVSPKIWLDPVKTVKGDLDADYAASGSTVPGGSASYKLTLFNRGNTKLTDFCVIDILPYIGDNGVYNTDARGSTWAPILVDGSFSPSVLSNFDVYYSSENTNADVSCTTNNSWYTLAQFLAMPGQSIQTVRSLKFVSKPGVLLDPGQSLELQWTMQAPTSVPTGVNEKACNSFGIRYSSWHQNADLSVVTDPQLPTEPSPVCLTALTSPYPRVGNYVWNDANQDGLQNETPAQGFNGMTIEAYTPANVLVASHVSTDDGLQNPGYYEFSLPPGSYYLRAIPPAGYALTVKDAGGDALDSDGDPNNGGKTPVFTLAQGTDDLSWDFGVYGTPPVVSRDICGVKFNDANHNGQRDAGEPGIAGWQITLTGPGSATSTISTGQDGSYCFNGLAPGTYTVQEASVDGWSRTFPLGNGIYTVVIPTSGNVVSYDFGNTLKCDDVIGGAQGTDPFACSYNFLIDGPILSPISSITMSIEGGTLADLSTTCPFTQSLGSLINMPVFTITFSPTCPTPLGGTIRVLPAAFFSTVTVRFTIVHAEGSVCTDSISFQCCKDENPCDTVHALPFYDYEHGHDYQRFFITNLEGSPITHVEIALDPQLTPGTGCEGWHDGGNLVDDGNPNPMFYYPFTVVPSDVPNTLEYGTQLVEFNIGIDWFCAWTGHVNFTVYHEDGTICLLDFGPWTVVNPRPARIATRTEPAQRLYANRLTVKNADARRAMKYVSVSTEDPQDRIFAITAASFNGATADPKMEILHNAQQGSGMAVFELRRPVLPGASTQFINVVVARDSARAGAPALRISTFDTDGNPLYSDSTSLPNAVLRLSEASSATSFALLGTFPNPASGRTAVSFTLDKPAPVRVELRNEADAVVRVIAEGRFDAGLHAGTFDAATLPPGQYTVRLFSEGRYVTAPVTVDK